MAGGGTDPILRALSARRTSVIADIHVASINLLSSPDLIFESRNLTVPTHL